MKRKQIIKVLGKVGANVYIPYDVNNLFYFTKDCPGSCSVAEYDKNPRFIKQQPRLTDEMIEKEFGKSLYKHGSTSFGFTDGAKWARDFYENNKEE